MQTSSYKVFARTYRPQMFSQILGQEVAVQIFQNALKHNTLSHAILLTGIRGVGKTTSARLLAKTLCCVNPAENMNPCGECPSCKAFQNEQHTDIIEMDAASHTGVDDVRDLIEGVAYTPTQGKYRVYIIDEVHMLSKSAFNALLKTLEEPPAHAKFIFATTELEKVPETIASRCLQIQLRPIGVDVIVRQLESICSKEQLNLNRDAIRLIAEAAQGSMRDGLSILEKVASFTRGQNSDVDAAMVERILGRPPQSELLALCQSIEGANLERAIEIIRSFFQHDIAPFAILKGILKTIHQALCETVLRKGNDNTSQDSASQGLPFRGLNVQYLNRLWSIAHSGLQEVLKSPLPKEASEVVIIRLIHATQLPPLKDIIEKIEAQLAGGVQETSAKGNAPVTQEYVYQNVRSAAQPTSAESQFKRFDQMVDWVESQRDPHLLFFVKRDLRVHSFYEKRVECSLNNPQHQDVLRQLKQLILEKTGENWVFEIVQITTQPPETVYEQQQSVIEMEKQAALKSDVVQHAINAFPEAIVSVEKETALTH